MDISPLPFRARLENYHKEAEDLAPAFKSGDRDAMRRVQL